MKEGKPQVLLVTSLPYFQWRGSPIRVRFNLLALTELGYEVTLVTVPVGEELPIPGVRVVRVGNPLGVKNLPIGPSLMKLFFDGLLLVKARRVAQRLRPVVVHGIEDTGGIAVVVARSVGAGSVFEKHSDPGLYRGGGLKNVVMGLYRRVEAWVIRRADVVIGTGESLCEQARQVKPGVRAHHIFDLPSSLAEAEAGKREGFRERFGGREGVVAMYVGSFEAYQGLDLMFEAIPKAVEECPGLRFVVIGGTKEQIAARQGWLEERGVGEKVMFPGKIPPDELPSALAAADVLLSPRSQGVNTPLKLLDYLKAGRPIVATELPSNRRLLDESMAVLCDPDPVSFAGAVVELAGDGERRERMGRAGREVIERSYSFGEYKARLGAVYDEARMGR